MNLWWRGQNIWAVFLARQIRAARRVGAPTGTVFSPVLLLGGARRYLVVRPAPTNLEPLRRFARGPGEIGSRPPSRRLMRASFSERARLVRTVPGYGKALAAGEGRRT